MLSHHNFALPSSTVLGDHHLRFSSPHLVATEEITLPNDRNSINGKKPLSALPRSAMEGLLRLCEREGPAAYAGTRVELTMAALGLCY